MVSLYQEILKSAKTYILYSLYKNAKLSKIVCLQIAGKLVVTGQEIKYKTINTSPVQT